ncbi:hypothetical protein MAPG_10590 [Magnaporthiopsis poae ATCC 64411]|uniref:Uncharacterized protein n=1 Tax=Magnaporthiopsis poae (strain ATCC 64411 / 73-15) TaxID=644358 RepID=A0A0C4ECZ9_MAGP6|nr:hypothetical protein MAPG_10590 [Magnaporthiopsis poae ATCC 64411]
MRQTCRDLSSGRSIPIFPDGGRQVDADDRQPAAAEQRQTQGWPHDEKARPGLSAPVLSPAPSFSSWPTRYRPVILFCLGRCARWRATSGRPCPTSMRPRRPNSNPVALSDTQMQDQHNIKTRHGGDLSAIPLPGRVQQRPDAPAEASKTNAPNPRPSRPKQTQGWRASEVWLESPDHKDNDGYSKAGQRGACRWLQPQGACLWKDSREATEKSTVSPAKTK